MVEGKCTSDQRLVITFLIASLSEPLGKSQRFYNSTKWSVTVYTLLVGDERMREIERREVERESLYLLWIEH